MFWDTKVSHPYRAGEVWYLMCFWGILWQIRLKWAPDSPSHKATQVRIHGLKCIPIEAFLGRLSVALQPPEAEHLQMTLIHKVLEKHFSPIWDFSCNLKLYFIILKKCLRGKRELINPVFRFLGRTAIKGEESFHLEAPGFVNVKSCLCGLCLRVLGSKRHQGLLSASLPNTSGPSWFLGLKDSHR